MDDKEFSVIYDKKRKGFNVNPEKEMAYYRELTRKAEGLDEALRKVARSKVASKNRKMKGFCNRALDDWGMPQ